MCIIIIDHDWKDILKALTLYMTKEDGSLCWSSTACHVFKSPPFYYIFIYLFLSEAIYDYKVKYKKWDSTGFTV